MALLFALFGKPHFIHDFFSIGLILAIPLYFAGKRKRVTMAFKAKSGETFTVAASNNTEAKVIKKYAGIGIFD